MTHHDADRELVDLLRQVDRTTPVPPWDPQREAALLAAFDDDAERPRPLPRWISAAAAIVLAVVATAVWMNVRRTAETFLPTHDAGSSPVAQGFGPASPADPGAPTEFVPWPGAAALPAFESGQLVRMDLPTSVLPSLGLFPPASDAEVVRADVLVGQDGLARAVRLLP